MFPQVLLVRTKPSPKTAKEPLAEKKKKVRLQKTPNKPRPQQSLEILKTAKAFKIVRHTMINEQISAICRSGATEPQFEYFIKDASDDLVLFHTVVNTSSGSRFLCCRSQRGFSSMICDKSDREVIFLRKNICNRKLEVYYPLTALSVTVEDQSRGCRTNLKFLVKNANGDTILNVKSPDRVKFDVRSRRKEQIGVIFKDYMEGEIYRIDLGERKKSVELVQKIAIFAVCILCDYIYDY